MASAKGRGRLVCLVQVSERVGCPPVGPRGSGGCQDPPRVGSAPGQPGKTPKCQKRGFWVTPPKTEPNDLTISKSIFAKIGVFLLGRGRHRGGRPPPPPNLGGPGGDFGTPPVRGVLAPPEPPRTLRGTSYPLGNSVEQTNRPLPLALAKK